eukprot:scaffold260369_cov24-Tisochrysis_lutea.AAC.1
MDIWTGAKREMQKLEQLHIPYSVTTSLSPPYIPVGCRSGRWRCASAYDFLHDPLDVCHVWLRRAALLLH